MNLYCTLKRGTLFNWASIKSQCVLDLVDVFSKLEARTICFMPQGTMVSRLKDPEHQGKFPKGLCGGRRAVYSDQMLTSLPLPLEDHILLFRKPFHLTQKAFCFCIIFYDTRLFL